MANAFGNAVAVNVGTTPVTVYTVPSLATYCAITLSILVTNLTGGTLPVDVKLVNPSRNNQPYLIKQKQVAGNDTVDLIKAIRVVVKPSESIEISTGVSNGIDCIISYVIETDL
jgi:hypothetical protein